MEGFSGLGLNLGNLSRLSNALASVAFWHQTLPTAPFSALPGADCLEVI